MLLLSRRLHSRDKLGLVDWPLLVLFFGLFVVNGALAGNLLLVGSIANLIVVDAASRHGIPIPWRRHARTGLPITLLTLLPLLFWGRS